MEKELEQLKGAMKMLNILWDNSYYSMGKMTSERIEREFIYYLGKDWHKKIGNIIEDNIPIKTLKELKIKRSPKTKTLKRNNYERN